MAQYYLSSLGDSDVVIDANPVWAVEDGADMKDSLRVLWDDSASGRGGDHGQELAHLGRILLSNDSIRTSGIICSTGHCRFHLSISHIPSKCDAML